MRCNEEPSMAVDGYIGNPPDFAKPICRELRALIRKAAPGDFAVALKRTAKAKTFFESLPPSCRREYIEWIITAKREETRTRRLNEAITMLGTGRRQNEQYRR